jgi:hypothetical protein
MEAIVFSFSEPIFIKKINMSYFVKQKPLKKQFIIPNSIVVMKNEKEVDL